MASELKPSIAAVQAKSSRVSVVKGSGIRRDAVSVCMNPLGVACRPLIFERKSGCYSVMPRAPWSEHDPRAVVRMTPEVRPLVPQLDLGQPDAYWSTLAMHAENAHCISLTHWLRCI